MHGTICTSEIGDESFGSGHQGDPQYCFHYIATNSQWNDRVILATCVRPSFSLVIEQHFDRLKSLSKTNKTRSSTFKVRPFEKKRQALLEPSIFSHGESSLDIATRVGRLGRRGLCKYASEVGSRGGQKPENSVTKNIHNYWHQIS